ncbi:MAG: AMP-dependent synthetase, partial [Acidobacteria bacterium]|nr:AMP-dependent synthetase [Candidatus Sulfomarinibacter sp. MAG AM1]
MSEDPQAERWQEYVAELRQPSAPPFKYQWARFTEIFGGRDPALPHPPVWVPDRERLDESNLAVLMRELGIDDYSDLHRWSVEHLADFWEYAIERLGIDFARPPERILDLSNGPAQPRWLPGAE